MSGATGGVYESWVPVVGQRVSVRVSPECRAAHLWLDGQAGVVAEINWSAADGPEPFCNDPVVDGYRGHWYMVDFDTPIDHPEEHRPIVADLFAVIELVPVGKSEPTTDPEHALAAPEAGQ